MFPLASTSASALRLNSAPCGAFRAGTEFAQKLPRVNAEVMIIVPFEADGIFAHTFGGNRLGRRFKQGQRAGGELGRLAGLASRLVALFVAHGARAGVAEVDKIVVGDVAVRPLNIDARPGGKVHLYCLGIGGRSGRLKRGLHNFSIAYERSARSGGSC